MLNITDQSLGLGGLYSLRNHTVKPVSHTASPPLAAVAIPEALPAEQTRSESQQENQGKQASLQRFFEEERKRHQPDPLDKAIEKAMSRMVTTRQAAERFLLGAVTLAPEKNDEPGHRLDAVA